MTRSRLTRTTFAAGLALGSAAVWAAASNPAAVGLGAPRAGAGAVVRFAPGDWPVAADTPSAADEAAAAHAAGDVGAKRRLQAAGRAVPCDVREPVVVVEPGPRFTAVRFVNWEGRVYYVPTERLR